MDAEAGTRMVSAAKEILEMDVEQREALLRRAEQAGVEVEDLRIFRAAFESYAYVQTIKQMAGAPRFKAA